VELRSTSIVVPADQAARQAVAPVEGYIYQLYRTVWAWQSLKENERLYVELAEDYTVTEAQSFEMLQIKRAKSALNLRSKSVAALIGAVWQFQDANRDRVVTAALVTTGRIGPERGFTFPKGKPGLEFWRDAAREGADLEPLRAALLTLNLPADLIEFLKTSAPEAVRERILRRIRWIGGGKSQEEVQRDIEERLVHFGSRLQVGAQESTNALSALLLAVLHCIPRPPAERYLTAADFKVTFEKNTHCLVPPSILKAQLVQSAGKDPSLASRSLTPAAASMPLPPRASLRTSVVGSLHSTLVAHGVLWLHGSSGLGKTTLALLLARQQQRVEWFFSDLRDLKSSELRVRLAGLSLEWGTSGGLILDDIPGDADNATILRVRQLASIVVTQDGVLVITSTQSPSPTLREALGLTSETICSVPYLREEDVASMVVQAGGDASVWAQIIHVFCGGHPQLVDARIAGLRHRGWPPAERLAELDPSGEQPHDVMQERRAARTRLLRELDGDSTELLLRLSLLTSAFDNAILQEVASVTPGVPRAGLLFEGLVGPWIEQLGFGAFRLSPLLRESGQEGLDVGLQRRVRRQVLEHLIERRPFPGEQSFQVLVLAYSLQHRQGLAFLAKALLSTHRRDKETFRRLAKDISLFTEIGTVANNPLFAPEMNLSCLLRLAQLHVAVANDQSARAAEILERLLWEIERVSADERHSLRGMALTTALGERTIPLAPRRWIGMLHDLAAMPGIGREFTRSQNSRGLIPGLLGLTYEQLLFAWRASALDGIDALAELIAVLDSQTPENRGRYLTAIRDASHTRDLVVSSAWLAEVRKPGFDIRTTVNRLADLYRIASAWNHTEIAVEIGCAQAVLLDEYAHDSGAALDILAAAQAKFPIDYRINRHRQRVYYRAGEHGRALAEFESFAAALERVPPLERIWAMRDAARSAAETGNMNKALSFFEGAWKAAQDTSPQMIVMKAGLSADCAVVEFELGHIESALQLMLRALTEAEAVDFTAGLREHYCGFILLAAILWMRGTEEDWPDERQTMVIGMCSDPNPKREIQQRKVPQRLLAWYQLAELEADRTESENVLAALRQRTTTTGLLPMEQTLTLRLARRAVRTFNVDRFIELLPFEGRAAEIGTQLMRQLDRDNAHAMPQGKLSPVTMAEWIEPRFTQFGTDAVLIFATAAVCAGRPDAVARLRAGLTRIDGLAASVTILFSLLDEPARTDDSLHSGVASTLGRMLQPGHVFSAPEAFGATAYFFFLLRRHELGDVAAVKVYTCFSDAWRDILTHRRFSMRTPAATEPAILESLAQGGPYLQRLARLILASESEIAGRFPDNLRTTVRQSAGAVGDKQPGSQRVNSSQM
jgi:hypothetical protein